MKRSHYLILAGLTLLGAALRLYGLSYQSLYNDELYSWLQTDYPTYGQVMREGIRPDAHPPGYLTVLYLSRQVLGDSEAMLRLPSAVAGVLCIPVIFLLGVQLFGPAEGLIAAALMTVSWAPIYYSQEVRAYALLILFVMLTAYCWTGVVRDRRRSAAVGYAVCAAATLYLHPMGVVFVGLAAVAMAVACLWDRRILIAAALANLAVFLLYLPWLGEFLRDSRSFTFGLERPGAASLVTLAEYMFGRSVPLTLLAGCFLAHLAWRAARRGISSAEVMLAVWALVPVVVVVVKSLLSEPILTNRNMLICLPPLYLLLARAVTAMPVGPAVHGAVAGAFSVALLVQLVFGLHYYTSPQKTQFREAVRFIVDHDQEYPGAPIVGWAWYAPQFDYYFVKLGSARRIDVMGNLPEHLALARDHLEPRHPRYVWFIYAHRPPEPGYMDYFRSHYREVLHERFVRAGVYLFRANSATSRPGSRATATTNHLGG